MEGRGREGERLWPRFCDEIYACADFYKNIISRNNNNNNVIDWCVSTASVDIRGRRSEAGAESSRGSPTTAAGHVAVKFLIITQFILVDTYVQTLLTLFTVKPCNLTSPQTGNSITENCVGTFYFVEVYAVISISVPPLL